MANQVDQERGRMGDKLREAREYLHLAQEEVAKILSVSRSAISLIENGQRKVEALELKRLADLYQRPVSWFTSEGPEDKVLPEEVELFAKAASDLSKRDREEVVRFAEFLRSRSKTETG